MLIRDFCRIGNKLYEIRKQKGMSRAEVAERAGLSDRTYADIERGSVNMRIETALRVCDALRITPDEAFTEEPDISSSNKLNNVLERLEDCTDSEKETVAEFINVYLKSLNK